VNDELFIDAYFQGWINDENPLEKASKIAKNNNFQTPIDEIDAAARILDPIFVGVAMDLKKKKEDDDNVGFYNNDNNCAKHDKKKSKTQMKVYGNFFKDYRETEW
jgi:hypothetical protein